MTNSFTNGTTSDATGVNQNFTDIINGTSDGTKNFNISALTCAGTVTLNGNMTFGNSSSNTLAFTASLNSSIPINTTNSFDIGSSTLGLRAIYFGANSQTVKIAGSSSMSATWTLTLPVSAGSNNQVLTTDGSGNASWTNIATGTYVGPYGRVNYGIAASVAASAMTVALKDNSGSDPSASSVVTIMFRNSTAATGTAVARTVSAALSMSIASGATLGSTNANQNTAYVYALDNSGTVELAVSGSRIFDEGSVQTTTAMSGSATSLYTLYSTTQRTSVPIRYLGRVVSTQTTAGTWATNPSEIAVESSYRDKVERHCVRVSQGNGYGSTNTKIRRYTNTVETIGTAITYADSSTNGGSFTINEEGVYAISCSEASGASSDLFGISKNSSQLTTNIVSITAADILAISDSPSAGNAGTTAAIVPLKVGDIIRSHGDGGSTGTTSERIRFTITKITG